MMSNDVLVCRVVDWDERYESPPSLKKTGPLAILPVSTDLGRVVMRGLLGQPGSAEILGVWYFLQMLAAQGERRGVLSAFGSPLTSQDLAKLSGFEIPLIERALRVLSGPEFSLLERVPLDTALQPPVIVPPPPPRKPRQPRPKAFSRCPSCNVDLVQLAESGEFDHLLIPDSANTGDDCDCDHGCDCGTGHVGLCSRVTPGTSAEIAETRRMRPEAAAPSVTSSESVIPATTADTRRDGQTADRRSRFQPTACMSDPQTSESDYSRTETPQSGDECAAEHSVGSRPAATHATTSTRSQQSQTAACRKHRKAARQAKKKARHAAARRRS